LRFSFLARREHLVSLSNCNERAAQHRVVHQCSLSARIVGAVTPMLGVVYGLIRHVPYAISGPNARMVEWFHNGSALAGR
jgi:hypothetical protein